VGPGGAAPAAEPAGLNGYEQANAFQALVDTTIIRKVSIP
jgi:hypothetical protein